MSKFGIGALAVSALAATSAAAMPPLVQAPATSGQKSPTLAAMFDTTLQLPEGRGIAQAMLELGVASTDAAEAAKLAAGHLGEGNGGCAAKIEIAQAAEGGARSLRRLVISTASGQTVIERRGEKLDVVPATELRRAELGIA